MAKKPLNGAAYSPWQILASANAYYALSRVFTAKVPKSIDEAGAQGPDMDESIASATNRILALELYLKALLSGASVEFPADHDLPRLYQALPEYVRTEVETNFNLRKSPADDPRVVAQTIHWFQLTQVPGQSIEDCVMPAPFDNTLSGLLERNRKAFVESRYLFDRAKYDAPTVFVYEHLRLAILCSVLCNLLEESLLNRSSQYVRTFRFEGWDTGPATRK